MSLFLGPMRHHIPGKKELTESVPLMELQPKKEVYIPLVAGANTDFEIFVQEGDAVKVGTKLACTKAGFCVPIYSSVSGTYKGIVKRMHNSLRPQNHMVIECDGQQEKIQAFKPLDYKSVRLPSPKCGNRCATAIHTLSAILGRAFSLAEYILFLPQRTPYTDGVRREE